MIRMLESGSPSFFKQKKLFLINLTDLQISTYGYNSKVLNCILCIVCAFFIFCTLVWFESVSKISSYLLNNGYYYKSYFYILRSFFFVRKCWSWKVFWMQILQVPILTIYNNKHACKFFIPAVTHHKQDCSLCCLKLPQLPS